MVKIKKSIKNQNDSKHFKSNFDLPEAFALSCLVGLALAGLLGIALLCTYFFNSMGIMDMGIVIAILFGGYIAVITGGSIYIMIDSKIKLSLTSICIKGKKIIFKETSILKLSEKGILLEVPFDSIEELKVDHYRGIKRWFPVEAYYSFYTSSTFPKSVVKIKFKEKEFPFFKKKFPKRAFKNGWLRLDIKEAEEFVEYIKIHS